MASFRKECFQGRADPELYSGEPAYRRLVSPSPYGRRRAEIPERVVGLRANWGRLSVAGQIPPPVDSRCSMERTLMSESLLTEPWTALDDIILGLTPPMQNCPLGMAIGQAFADAGRPFFHADSY